MCRSVFGSTRCTSRSRAVLTMPQALEAVEDISRKQSTGEVVVHPRRRFELPGGGFFHYMAAADYSAGFVAMKQYTYVRGKLQFPAISSGASVHRSLESPHDFDPTAVGAADGRDNRVGVVQRWADRPPTVGVPQLGLAGTVQEMKDGRGVERGQAAAFDERVIQALILSGAAADPVPEGQDAVLPDVGMLGRAHRPPIRPKRICHGFTRVKNFSYSCAFVCIRGPLSSTGSIARLDEWRENHIR